MIQQANSRHWTLRGLVYCGYCEQQMYPAQLPGGPRAYQCGFRCDRSDADAKDLEEMAYRAALAVFPSLTPTANRVDRAALFAEMYRRIIVHDDVSDVRFIGYAT